MGVIATSLSIISLLCSESDSLVTTQNDTIELIEVEIVASPFKRTAESPLSLRSISSTEIYRNPGGNRDISKVIQLLPGVATTVAFRNDIIVRGGSPAENSFYIDGIEVPNINHFSTQGSSGGPVSMINVAFIKEAKLYAGAFPIAKGGVLSSVMEISTVTPKEGLKGSLLVGSSDIGAAAEYGNNNTLMVSVRRSYLQYLFKLLKLPFLPTYTDIQVSSKIDIGTRGRLTLLGLGAYDDFELNSDVNRDIDDPKQIEKNNYLLNSLPINRQWNYTVGGRYELTTNSGKLEAVLSRSMLHNSSEKPQLLDYSSDESENHARVEWNLIKEEEQLKIGAEINYSRYSVDVDYESSLDIWSGAIYAGYSRRWLEDRLSMSLGVRADFSDYSKSSRDITKQIAPKVALSYKTGGRLILNGSGSVSYQLPPYTLLGYRLGDSRLINQDNNIGFIGVKSVALGVEYLIAKHSRVTIEGYKKWYSDYPMMIPDSVSLANLGGNFDVVGAGEALPISIGESYGLELLLHQRLREGVYGILSYTWGVSEFSDKDGVLTSSSWDSRHILNITAGTRLKKRWEVGAKFRFQSALPYTPYDKELSAIKEVWEANKEGVPDYNRLNSERSSAAHGLDIRIDKRFIFNRESKENGERKRESSLEIYLDIQNIYGNEVELQPYLDVVKDNEGLPMEDPNDPSRYLLKEIANSSGTTLPSIGLLFEF